MNVMQQSSKAHDQRLGGWLVYIEKGMVKFPRIQRIEAWNHGQVKRTVFPINSLLRPEARCTRKTQKLGV